MLVLDDMVDHLSDSEETEWGWIANHTWGLEREIVYKSKNWNNRKIWVMWVRLKMQDTTYIPKL